jgi:5-methylcytosine-specific restriction endonuclease McrBC regulatory subunit McrC
MRKTTEKRFKRFDLLLRNEDKSGIIDWKFSKLMAEQKIKGNGVKNKNRQYYQLAYKDFLTDV